jgi:hypothetical protein
MGAHSEVPATPGGTRRLHPRASCALPAALRHPQPQTRVVLTSRPSFPRTLLHQVAVNVEPSLALANETTALVLANGGGIADTRARDKLHFGRSAACNARINNIQAQPFLILSEWN